MILKFKNDSRFQLQFIGKGANELLPFCKDNNVKNVVIKDSFSPDESLNYFKQSDIIFNLYGNSNPVLNYALSNKLYYASSLGMPI